MLKKWTIGCVLTASLFSAVAYAEAVRDCVDENTFAYLYHCKLSLAGVKKVNDYYASHPETDYFVLTEVTMDKDVSAALVDMLELNKGITYLSLYETNFAATEVERLANNNNLSALTLVNNHIDEANFLHLMANKSIIHFYFGEKEVSNDALLHFLKEHPLEGLGLDNRELSENEMHALFKANPKFVSLILNNIKIKDFSPLTNLHQLKWLAVQQMDVTEEDAAVIGKMNTLKGIDLTDTSISAEGTGYFAQLKNLEVIYFYNSESENNKKLGDEGVRFINQLPKIKDVYLFNEGITDKGAISISQNPSISNVELPFNQVGDEGAIALSHLPSLKTASLGSNEIGNAGAIAMAMNDSIHELNLSNNKVGDEGGLALANQSNLKTLYIMSNLLSDVTAWAFANRTSVMEALIIYNNQFSENAITAMKNNSHIDYVGAGSVDEGSSKN